MLRTFHVTPKDKPHVVLFTGDLPAIAECLRAQPDPADLSVYTTVEGFSRDLTTDELRELAALMP